MRNISIYYRWEGIIDYIVRWEKSKDMNTHTHTYWFILKNKIRIREVINDIENRKINIRKSNETER